MSISRVLADLACKTVYESISGVAVDAAKKLILDSLGTAIAGCRSPGIQEVFSLMNEWGGAGQASVFIEDRRLPVPNAAFINSTMVHALDFDDIHRPAALHITSSVVPAAFAVGELMHSSGKDILRAVIMGIEVAARLGCEFLNRVKHAGFLPSTVIGGFGATTTACLLMNMDVSQVINAFGIYYAQTSGNRQALYDLTLTKRIQPAFAVRDAVWSAFLAHKGVTGAENAFEGEAGLFRVYADGGVPDESVIGGHRDFFEVERVTIKRFPTCGADHAAILAALDLYNDLKPAFDDIEEMGVYVGEGGNPMVANPFSMEGNLQVNAQFSAPYAVALALLRGRVGISDISQQQIEKDTEVAQLAQRVEIIRHWEYERPDRKLDANEPDYHYELQMVRVKTKAGKIYLRSRPQRDWINPQLMSSEDVVRKFMENAGYSGVISPKKAVLLVEEIKGIEKAADVNDVIQKHLVRLDCL